jgi:hypothetical protein
MKKSNQLMKSLSLITIGILIFSLLPSIYAPPANDDQEYWPPFTSKKHPYGTPLYQLKGESTPENIRCDPGLVLTIKHNGNPACVKPQTAQILVERGWNVAKSAVTHHILENNCGRFYIAPQSQSYTRTPVLLMDSNSTACARLTFTIRGNYSDSWSRIEVFSPLTIGNYNFTLHNGYLSSWPGKDYTDSFHIAVEPQLVDLADFPIHSNFTVTYMIKPLSNATGFYDHSIPKLACERYPLAVGYSADQVSYSDFNYIDPITPPCVSGPYVLTLVEISGMSYKEVLLQPYH